MYYHKVAICSEVLLQAAIKAAIAIFVEEDSQFLSELDLPIIKLSLHLDQSWGQVLRTTACRNYYKLGEVHDQAEALFYIDLIRLHTLICHVPI